MSDQQFESTIETGERGRVFILIPFSPKEVWGQQERYYVQGTLNGTAFQGSLGIRQKTYFMPLNKNLQQRAMISPGDHVLVTMKADVARQEEVPEDVEQALAQTPEARNCFDGLTVFQRNQYLQWIQDARKPETRTARLVEMLALLKAGKKKP